MVDCGPPTGREIEMMREVSILPEHNSAVTNAYTAEDPRLNDIARANYTAWYENCRAANNDFAARLKLHTGRNV